MFTSRARFGKTDVSLIRKAMKFTRLLVRSNSDRKEEEDKNGLRLCGILLQALLLYI